MKHFPSKHLLLLLLPFVFIVSAIAQSADTENDITPQNALEHYITNGDKTYKWEIKDSIVTDKLKTYSLLLTSQKWQQFTWTHQLTIFVPAKNNYDGGLLFITGGSIKDGLPKWTKPDDQVAFYFSEMAVKNKAVVAILHQTPNQPLYNGLYEDALISKTLHDFKNDGDYSKPLLFPMVKSAVKAMDAIQELMQQRQHAVNRFVVAGLSKRGWTTWLTGAIDERVTAIAPMVIDVLNMPVSLNYQLEAFGEYSDQINDYVNLGILKDMQSESGNALVTMIDPYSYRKSLDMPKMLFMGTNDPYWVVDNVKNYLEEIPGKTLLHYVPNAGHDLGGGLSSLIALSAFYGITLNKADYPEDNWSATVEKNEVQVTVNASKDILTGVKVWSAQSNDRDFRNDQWQSRDLNIEKTARFTVKETLPKSGYKAFYVDMKYKDPNGGEYTVSTRVFMTDTEMIL